MKPARLLLAPDKFKGSASAEEVARALQRGFERVWPEVQVDILPLADGGEGTVKVLAAALGGELIACDAADALGRTVRAELAWIPERKLAVVECSDASGLWRLQPEERNPWLASSFGTGLCLQAALDLGAEEIYLGLGGSAMNDAGCGLAVALGWQFLDDEGDPVEPIPAHFQKIHRCCPPDDKAVFRLTGLADVTNPLLGPSGCTAVFAPQKGLAGGDEAAMEAAMSHLADVVEEAIGRSCRAAAGAGAAGGLGFGLMAFAGGQLESGFDVIARATGLEKRMQAADLVVTAEGKLDQQTTQGKGPAGVAAMARGLGKPVIAFGGMLEDEEELAAHFDAVVALPAGPISSADSMRNAPELLEKAATRAARLVSIHSPI